MHQITHLGRRAQPIDGQRLPAIGPLPVRETLRRIILLEMETHDIGRVVASYAAAARRC